MNGSVAIGGRASAFWILVATVLTAWLVFEYAHATQALFHGFPSDYTWTELLLNYQVGSSSGLHLAKSPIS